MEYLTLDVGKNPRYFDRKYPSRTPPLAQIFYYIAAECNLQISMEFSALQ